MDFDKLPDIVFLRIFDYLPLKDRFRVGRVSQSFRSISQIVNGRIKTLNLNDFKFSEPGCVDQFEVVLRLCHHNLREIIFFRCSDDRSRLLTAKFSEFTCPQLIDLHLGPATVTHDVFARIVANHPNLKNLKWWPMFQNGNEILTTSTQFPPGILSNLESLRIGDENDAALECLIDRCPNLRTLETMTAEGSSSVNIWDRFFRSVPRLESLGLCLARSRIRLENVEGLWRLPLTSITIVHHGTIAEFMVKDALVHKLVEHFTNIEHVNLMLFEATDDALAALARLEKLRVAELSMKTTQFTDLALREFSACQHLEELVLYCSTVSEQTFLDLFRNCPHLRKLKIRGVYGDSGDILYTEATGMLILQLANIPHRPTITIEMSCVTYELGLYYQEVWKSIQVQNAVQNLKENRGIEINIRLVDMAPPPPAQA